MGVSPKTLSRLMSLHESGLLRAGAAVVELGAQSLYCRGSEHVVREMIAAFAGKNPSLRPIEDYKGEEIARLADGGFMSTLLTACGFAYTAIDIFEAPNTRIFDLNYEDPGPDIVGRFDLVTNFGTTEHILNQLQALKTMHALARPGGILYHDLPLGGFYKHGYFAYTPLLFRHLAAANGYKTILERFTRGIYNALPRDLRQSGYPGRGYYDLGIEYVLQKTADEPFKVPLETSTSIGVSVSVSNRYDYIPPGAPGSEALPDTSLTDLSAVSFRQLLGEVLWRLRNKLVVWFRPR